uniref:S1 motif domain-containing protein n=4 Tax=Schistocephalus solidus TaxID=70667 RepID=A0A0V0J1H2_SCHSO
MDAFEDAWKRLLLPHITRKVRSKFTSLAHDLSLGVFSDNLRRLLMSAPLRCAPLPPAGAAAAAAPDRVFSPTHLNETSSPDVVSAALGSPGDRLPVVGLDPGWRHGCKWAACDPLGTVLQAGVLHITSTSGDCPDSEMQLFTRTMKSHGINTIGLGNGQACRQTEKWLAQAVANGLFAPLRVRYTIVSECGASVYSASPLADRELPTLDVSLRGAVSIARRLQDPLAELVKIEPQHLGVGMYQHDLPPKRLEEAVNELMEECISFVGVDVNTAQQHVLARVAGLSDSKARAIIAYRSTNGRIRCRQELLKIKGIGRSTFSQCAGFLRVRPNYSNVPMDSSKDVEFISLCSDDDVEMEVVSGKRRLRLVSGIPARPVKRKRGKEADSGELSFNPLDQTAIHPDSYDLATSLIRYLRYEISDVGCPALRNAAQVLYNSPNRDCTLAQFQTSAFGIETTRDILEALCRPLDFDERQDQFGPLFRSSITSMMDLRPGLQVTGRVENVTTFGAFVDIGLEESAFLPLSAFPRTNRASASAQCLSSSFAGKTDITHMTLHLGDRVKATVSSIDVKWGRVALAQVSLLQ